MQILIRNLLLTIIILSIVLRIHAKRKNKSDVFLYNLGIILFSLSMVFIFSLTGISPLSGFHFDIRIAEISFIPFKGILELLQNGITRHSFINIVGNIIMFLPVGFLLPLIYSKINSYKKILAFGFCTSLLIEISQLFLTRGTDIDDLILNTFGTLLGYLIFLIFKKIFSNFTEKIITISKSIQSIFVLLSAIIIPYVIIIICGFYDRFIS